LEKIPFDRKLVDTATIAPMGRVDKYWHDKILTNVYAGKRPKKIDSGFRFYEPEFLSKSFGLKGFEFGNWLSQEDRYVYMAGAAFAMRDFCRLFDINDNTFGLKRRITISLGARGHGGNALAHFEPSTFAINLTKYRANDSISKYLGGASGAGSLGHEYAHALDLYAGRFIDKNGNFNFLSQFLSIAFEPSGKENDRAIYSFHQNIVNTPLKRAMVDSLGAIMYTRVKGNIYKDSDFYYKLKIEVAKQAGMGKYWTSIIEIWARSFEVLLFTLCEKKGIEESFLKKRKYSGFIYPDRKLFTPKVVKAFKDFTSAVIKSANI
jgi:hypothetical protein